MNRNTKILVSIGLLVVGIGMVALQVWFYLGIWRACAQ